MEQEISLVTLNQAANAVTLDTIKLHSGSVGADGTANQIVDAEAAATYAAASDGVRDLSDTVNVPVPEGATVSHFSVWEGATFKYGNVLDSNPETFSNAGIAVIASAKVSFFNEVANE
ncbi:hypothetical protein ACQKDY_00410 [Alteromonas macleodii]|uniref:hypothetical protein n=1 Tax=Alteromonas macleodii TaxID=28108 RepID=UPI003D068537